MEEKLIKFVVFLSLTLVWASCAEDKPKSTEQKDKMATLMTGQESEGYELLKTTCYVCHNPQSPSHDELLAPPMAAVKMRYNMQYGSAEEFVEAIVSWTMDPQENKALMKGAVMKFKTMPKQPFKEEEMRKIATYIYYNELEEPLWFASHKMEMHGKGKMGKMFK
jgi:mono/diheme cytochrome c family protein